MVKTADIGSKRLISLAPDAWAKWVTQENGIQTQELLNSEFQWISRESDVLIKAIHPIEGEFLILNELQLRYTAKEPRRVRAYAALAEEKYRLPVFPVLINFLPPNDPNIIQSCYDSTFLGLNAHQDYRIINLWEIDANVAFQDNLFSLLPFVPIMQNGNTALMLQEAARGLREVEGMTDFEPLLGFFANFVLDSALVQQILRWDMVILEQSPWYNEILRRGEERGEARGEARGRQAQAADFVLRQLSRKLGTIAPDLQLKIQSLELDRLEALGEDLLDFSSLEDLVSWLA